MTSIAPSSPIIPSELSLQARKLASSSKIGIASLNCCNWCMTTPANAIRHLALQEAPYSSCNTTGEITTGHNGMLYELSDSYTAGEFVDCFVIGIKTNASSSEIAAGNGNPISGHFASTSGDSYESIVIMRDGYQGDGGMYCQYKSYDCFSICLINENDARENPPGTGPSETYPDVSLLEDGVIADGTAGGRTDNMSEHIRYAWRRYKRGLFSVTAPFSSATTSFTNLVDHLVDTSGFTVDVKARQLYQEDTTTEVICWANGREKSGAGALEVKFSGSKGSTTLVVSTGSAEAYDRIPVDCLAEDSITVSFRATGGATGLFFSAGMIESLSTDPD